MMHYMPEIFYHDRKALLSVDIHPVKKNGRYRLATVSVQNEVRIWDFNYDEKDDRIPICVNFVANLEGHNAAINQVKFSQNPECDVLASGDVHGRISVWQLSDQPCTTPPAEDFPQNKENWVRVKVFNHESDVTALDFSHCGKYLASVSNDDSLQVHEALTGKRQFIVSYLRHFPNGVTYDPLGKYIMTMSTDRRMDLVCAKKGTRLRSFGVCELPEIAFNQISLEAKTYKLFHDDQLTTFTRNCAFSPCGQLIVAPVGRLEVKSQDFYCTYVFRRWELEKDRPAMLLPCPKPTFCIRFCPIIFELDPNTNVNYSGLPYRVIWLALTRESIIIYDSQHPQALALIENISYNNMSDAAWSRDGRNIVASSMEGYCHYLKLKIDQLGVEVTQVKNLPQCPESPHFVKKKVKKEKKPKEEEPPATPSTAAAPAPSTPTTAKNVPNTPKTTTPGGGLLRFLKRPNKGDSPVSSRTPSSDQQHHTENGEPKAKKRINLMTLE